MNATETATCYCATQSRICNVCLKELERTCAALQVAPVQA